MMDINQLATKLYSEKLKGLETEKDLYEKAKDFCNAAKISMKIIEMKNNFKVYMNHVS